MLRLAAKSRSILRKAITIHSRSLSTCSPSSPWLMLPPSAEEGSGRTYNFYSLAKEKVVSFNCNNKRTTKMRSLSYPDMDESEFVGSSHGWIALFNPQNTDLFLFNPLTGRHIKLPPLDTIYTPPNEYTRAWVKKIIITCPPDSPPQGGYLCRAVMQYNTNRLAYCTPGSSTCWTGPIDTRFKPACWYWGVYDDFVYDPESHLLICVGDGFEAWDITNSKDDSCLVFENRDLLKEYYQQQQLTEEGYRIQQCKHLVVQGGDQIFLVFRDFVVMETPDSDDYFNDYGEFPCKTVGFRVHRIYSEGVLGESEADSLDGLALFVGRNHSFALLAADHPGLMPNSVYFTQHRSSILPTTAPVYRAYGGHDIGVFDYESKTISPCYCPCDEHSFKRIMPAPMWFTPTPNPPEFN